MPATVEGTDGSTNALATALRGASLSADGKLPVTSINGSSKGKHDVVEPVTGAAPSPVLSTEEAAPSTMTAAATVENGSSMVALGDEQAVTSSSTAVTVEAPDPDKPNQRFIDGCPGDLEEAKRRWRITLQWRKDFGTDEILEKPHKFFDLIKDSYPSWYCCEGRTGQPVYYERSGQVDQRRMRAAGCGVEELVWHYIWMTEFCYNQLHPSETAKTITVLDVQGVGIRDLAGEAFDFLRRSIHLIGEHYPERSLVIMIVGAPSWFSVLWKMIRPLVNSRTQAKIKICSKKETFETIKEFVAPEFIPVEYGGLLKYSDEPDSCRRQSPEEVRMREFVLAVNKRHGVEMVKG